MHAIDVQDVTMIYGGTVALDQAVLQVRPGEIHGLLGENGAGKSTLVRIIAGVERPHDGTVRLFGESVGDEGPDRRTMLGCAFIHQDLALIADLSIAENMAFVLGFPSRGGLLDTRRLDRQAREALALLGIDLDVRQLVGQLSVAVQTIVAIARAVATGARLVVLDEPTAKLQAGEVRALFELLRRLRAEAKVAFLLITHRLDDVREVCDRITVFRNGRTVATRNADAVTNAEMISLIIGKDPVGFEQQEEPVPGAECLTARALVTRNAGPLDVDLGLGEIVALTGLADAGHLDVAAALGGAQSFTAERVALDSVPYSAKSCAAALGRGIAYLPPDRIKEAAIGPMTAAENLFLNPSRRKGQRANRTTATTLLRCNDVRPPEPDRLMSTFSGGNQQKLVLGRLLDRRPRVLILAEPTAAVDIGAKFEIWRRLRELSRAHSTAVLVASSDFEEVARLSDRVIVLRRGLVAGQLRGEKISVEAITSMAYRGKE